MGLGPSEAPVPPAWPGDDEVRGKWLEGPFPSGSGHDRKIRRMPLRAGSGRVTQSEICGRPQNRGAVTGGRGKWPRVCPLEEIKRVDQEETRICAES